MNEYWLLDSGIMDALTAASATITPPTMEEFAAYEETFALSDEGLPQNMSVSGDTATVKISGLLTDSPSWMARIFGSGNTVYRDIVTSFALAESAPEVKKINLLVTSGGGVASAEWIDAMDAIKNAKKPVTAYVGSMAASAAYGLASQADEIIAQNRMSLFGSIGVITSVRQNEDIIKVASSNAPKKDPDASTEAGKAAIRERIDAMEKIFIDTVADGRATTSEKVIADFGQGGIVLAEDAVKRGMIDSVNGGASAPSNTAGDTNESALSGQTNTETIKMDLKELMTNHSDVYAQCVEVGEKSERARVSSHLGMGKSYGAMDIAVKACTEGTDVVSLMADYAIAQNDAANATTEEGETLALATAGAAKPKPKTELSEESQEDKDAMAVADFVTGES